MKKSNITAGLIGRLYFPFALGFFLSVLFRVVNSVMAPELIAAFNLSAADLGLVTSTYLLAFAIAQYPLGVLLDRFGPKRVLMGLMIFAALGAFIFGRATGLQMLMAGRGLIGLGVSGCLMCAFKAYGDWLPAERLPLINGFQMFAGGLGGMAATTPVKAALGYTDWRGVFMFLAVLCIVNILFIFLVVPKKEYEKSNESFGQQFLGTLEIIKSADFWRLAPIAIFVQGSYLAVQSLWIGPWLKDVGGISPDQVTGKLSIVAISIAAGYLLNGVIADFMRKFGVKPAAVCVGGMTAFTAVLGIIVLLGNNANIELWLLFVFLGPFSLISYPVFSNMFDKKLAGRVITLYNLSVFLISFAIQWLTGVVIDMYPLTEAGGYSPEGYSAAFTAVFALNAISLLWVFVFKKGNLEFFEVKVNAK